MAQILFKDVSFAYPNGVSALDGVSFEIEQGESIAIIGRNGAGKSTAAKLMNGLLKPEGGEVLIGGISTKNQSAAHIAHSVGYAFQNPDDQIFHSSVESEVEFGPKLLRFGDNKKKSLVGFALEISGLSVLRKSNPYDLSFSERRFVAIASVIAADSPVIILDEPTAGQDLKGLSRLSKILSELRGMGKTIVTITHDMQFVADNFPRVLVVSDRKIAASGPPRKVFEDLATLESAGLRPPFANRICRELGLSGDTIRTEEVIDVLAELLLSRRFVIEE